MLDSKNQNYQFFDNWGGYKQQTIRFMKSYNPIKSWPNHNIVVWWMMITLMAINDNGDQKEDLHLFPSRRKQNKRVMHSLQLFYFSMVSKTTSHYPSSIQIWSKTSLRYLPAEWCSFTRDMMLCTFWGVSTASRVWPDEGERGFPTSERQVRETQ